MILRAIVLILATAGSVFGAEQFVQPLISVQRNLNTETWQITSHEITPNCSASWAIHKYRLHGGKQEGIDVIICNNGKLRMTVVPTRGMGVLSVTCEDVRLGWDSPVQQVVNPQNINLQARSGLGWLDGFNEYIARCGLEFAGHAGADKFINNVGAEATMDLTLHGKIENIPASEVEVAVDLEAPYRIHIRGRVDERSFYGPKLEITTDLSTEPGTRDFRIDDSVANRGDAEQEFELLYHTNYGPPLLEGGSTFVGAMKKIAPFNPNAAKGLDHINEFKPPTPGFIEQVYNMTPLSDSAGKTQVLLRNSHKDRAIEVEFSPRELPCFTLWKNTTAVREGYVTGLEPGTNFAYNRRIERQAGRVQKLKPGEEHHAGLEFKILTTADAVSAAADRIIQLQKTVTPEIGREPEATE